MISSSQRPLHDNTQHSQHTNFQALSGIRTHNRSRRAAVDIRLRPRGHWDRQLNLLLHWISYPTLQATLFPECFRVEVVITENRSEIPGRFRNAMLEKDGPIVREIKKCYRESGKRGISYKQYKRRNTNLIGHIILKNYLLRRVIEWNIEGKDRSDGKTRKKK